VFLDPPYSEKGALQSALDGLGQQGLLAQTSVAVIEQPWDVTPPDGVADLGLMSTRKHGRTRLSLYASDHS
jgi:16S rRNA G966 N2-methylase RsmD